MAAIPKLVLPLAALGSLGAATVSGVGSLLLQNPLALAAHSDIPRAATPYNSWFARLGGKVETNHTLTGYLAWAVTFGAVLVGTRIAVHPLTNLLRKQFIFVPGTTTPKRIKNFNGLLFDLCPDVVVNTIPFIPAFPIAMFFKVWADGPGRFKDWPQQYNPYDSVVAHREEIYSRPTLPVYALEKVEKTDLIAARSLWESKDMTIDEKLADMKLLQH